MTVNLMSPMHNRPFREFDRIYFPTWNETCALRFLYSQIEVAMCHIRNLEWKSIMNRSVCPVASFNEINAILWLLQENRSLQNHRFHSTQWIWNLIILFYWYEVSYTFFATKNWKWSNSSKKVTESNIDCLLLDIHQIHRKHRIH